MKIRCIIFDWQNDQYQSRYEIGKNGVLEITVHPAGGEGDKWYWRVEFEDGHVEDIFNINRVFYDPER
jgi:hypothetical protein